MAMAVVVVDDEQEARELKDAIQAFENHLQTS